MIAHRFRPVVIGIRCCVQLVIFGFALRVPQVFSSASTIKVRGDKALLDRVRCTFPQGAGDRAIVSSHTVESIGGHDIKRTSMQQHPVTLIRSEALSDAAQYAYAATAPSNARLIFLAGSCPLNLDGSTAGAGDYRVQAAKCIENMSIALEAAGASMENVISTRVLVASSEQADLGAAWEVVHAAFGDHDVPSTLMGVTVLGYTNQLVEIEAVAAVID